MSVALIKQEVSKLGQGEILHLAAYLKHLSRRGDPAYAAGLDATWNAMSAGDRISLGEYQKVSEELKKSGV
jgi:hypothetical protein